MRFSENQSYGHAQILLDHCGLPADTFIPFRIQHGWQPGPGLGERHGREPGTKLVWSKRNLGQAEEHGIQGAVPIGAPFLYLPAPLTEPKAAEKSLLAIPFHGWEEEGLFGSVQAYAESLTDLKKRGFGPITVCLYWLEYGQPEVRAFFEERGFETTTMGHRENNPEFLVRQRELIRRHSAVTSNRIATATFYALSMGTPFFLSGAVQGLAGSADPTGAHFDLWQQTNFPTLLLEHFDGTADQSMGLTELGAEYVRSPEALGEVLMAGPGYALSRATLRTRLLFHDMLRTMKLR